MKIISAVLGPQAVDIQFEYMPWYTCHMHEIAHIMHVINSPTRLETCQTFSAFLNRFMTVYVSYLQRETPALSFMYAGDATDKAKVHVKKQIIHFWVLS